MKESPIVSTETESQDIPHIHTENIITLRCSKRIAIVVLIYSLVVAICALLVIYASYLGVFLLGLLPAITVIYAFNFRYSAVLIMQQCIFFLVLGMFVFVPLFVAELLISFFFEWIGLDLTSKGLTGLSVTAYLVSAFVISGIVDESAKYGLIWTYHKQPMIIHPISLVVYGCCIAAGLAANENILYAFVFGTWTGVFRSVFTMPGHFATGMIIGAQLAKVRFGFVEPESMKFYHVVGLPILIRTVNTFIILITTLGSGTNVAIVLGMIIICAINLAALIYVRYMFLQFAVVALIDVWDYINAGALEKPPFCNCPCRQRDVDGPAAILITPRSPETVRPGGRGTRRQGSGGTALGVPMTRIGSHSGDYYDGYTSGTSDDGDGKLI